VGSEIVLKVEVEVEGVGKDRDGMGICIMFIFRSFEIETGVVTGVFFSLNLLRLPFHKLHSL